MAAPDRPATTAEAPAADLAALRAAIAGDVVLPGSPSYETVRKPALARYRDARPQAIVRCRHGADVAETLAVARRSGVRVALRSGGHCFAGRSSTDGIVIDVSPMREVSVSGDLATVGAGTRLGELYDALHRHGVTLPAGCGDTVGIAGLALGGGIGILGRIHGLTCDRLVAAQVVLADGRVVDCDERRQGDLFWALRGAGGGQFGVVTSLVFRTVPAPTSTAFALTWPPVAAEAVIAAWQDWAPDADDGLNATLRVKAHGEADRPPIAILSGAMLAGESETVDHIGRLIAASRAEPASTWFAELPYRDVKPALADADDPEAAAEPPVELSKTELFRRSLPPEAISALRRILEQGRHAGQSRELAFTPLGGAYNRVAADATAFAHRSERFVLEHVVRLDAGVQAAEQAAPRWVHRSWACAHPWGSGRVYPNFPDPDLPAWAQAYHGDNIHRLRRVKRFYDPENLFHFPQSIPPGRRTSDGG